MATQTFSRVLIQAKMMEKNVPARPSVFQLLKHAPIYYLHGKTDESFDLRRPKWFTFSRLGILLPLAASFWSLGKQWAFSARWCFFCFSSFHPDLGKSQLMSIFLRWVAKNHQLVRQPWWCPHHGLYRSMPLPENNDLKHWRHFFPCTKMLVKIPLERQILANGLLVHDDLHWSLQGGLHAESEVTESSTEYIKDRHFRLGINLLQVEADI